MIDKNRLIEVCKDVANDVERDAEKFDGKPFNGRTIAEYMGNHGAAIKALADILKTILENENTDKSGG